MKLRRNNGFYYLTDDKGSIIVSGLSGVQALQIRKYLKMENRCIDK